MMIDTLKAIMERHFDKRDKLATGRNEKLVQIRKAIKICEESMDNFVIQGL